MLDAFLKKLKQNPNGVSFDETMATIEAHYCYTPTEFINGGTTNMAGSNEGSCKVFAFAKLHNLNKEDTLACFGSYYRIDVLGNPSGSDHANIRNFMISGWDGITFDNPALALRSL